MDMYDDEEGVKALVNYCEEVVRDVADYYIEAGCDVIAAVDPLVSQISPDMFETFLSEPYSKFFAAMRERGVPSSFFVCGDATKNIEPMCLTKPDCIAIDENVDIVEAKKSRTRTASPFRQSPAHHHHAPRHPAGQPEGSH